ncbi:MAG TPA: ABC transporter permease, partial [Iamia sp.]|nr:ABC transporter permease [Iamia sp.]
MTDAPTGPPAPTESAGTLVRAPGRAERDPNAYLRWRRLLELACAIAVPVTLGLAWQLASSRGWIDARVYPSPVEIGQAAVDLVRDGELVDDLLATARRVALGWAIGSTAGLVLGLAMGSVRLLRRALEPTLDALYVVPKLALLPVLLNMFGLGEGPKVALVAVTVFFFVWIGTMTAVMAVPEGYRETGAAFGASRAQMFRHVLVPGALPQIVVALRVAAGVAVLVIVAAEFIVGDSGLGYLIFNSRALFINDRMYVGIVVVALFGVAFSELIRALGRLVTPWAPQD